jgi:hypothetical protein
MSEIDTSPEALRNLVIRLNNASRWRGDVLDEAAATLNALAAEKERAAPAPAELVQDGWLAGEFAAIADEAAVDRFAAAMKAKLADARAKGRGGWQDVDPTVLSAMLREHVEKGDPRDVANFCMFLWSLGHGIGPAPATKEAVEETGK